MIDKDFIQEVIERASEEGVSYNHKFECVYKLIQNFILVHDMENNNEGQALLYAVEKTAERTKREVIEKAAEWFEKYLFDIGYPDDWCRDSPNLISGKDRFIKAMQDESK